MASESILKERLKKVRGKLKELQVDALLVENTTDLFYLTGLEVSVGHLIIHRSTARFFVDGRYYEACKSRCPLPVALSGEGALSSFIKSCRSITTLGFDASSTTYTRFQQIKQVVRKARPGIKLKATPSPLASLREIKDSTELTKLRRAAKLGCEGFDFVVSKLKKGITEIEVAKELDIFWKRKGSSGVAFDPIIAFGNSSSKPHYHPTTKKLKVGDPILIDIGVTLDNYHSDMTRVVFLGRPQKKMVEVYETVKEAQQEALKLCKPGVQLEELDQRAREVIDSKGFGEFFTHSLGHGIGLEVHEFPFFRKVPKNKPNLEPGMVITIEPGVYLPNYGGVRIEDTVIITSKGHQNLTPISKDLRIL